jgi:hypothetical protein
MVLMHNAPLTINLPETHGQSKFQFFAFAVCAAARALSYRCGKAMSFPAVIFTS